jgi:hypothetical protein
MRRTFSVGVFVLGLSLTVGLVGCSKSTDTTAKPAVTDDAHEHGHGETGPHKGHIIELGEEEFHGELVHDEANSKVVVYLLDSSAKASASADGEEVVLSIIVEGQPKDFTLKATDAAKRDQFESTEPQLVASLDHEKNTKGRLRVTIGKKDFVGVIDHEGHTDKK